MTSYVELLPVTKSEKHGVLTWEPATDNESSPFAGVLTLAGKRDHCRYRVSEFPADAGRGFLVEKLDAGTDRTEGRYSVLVGPGGGGLCECKGFAFTGRCKHLAGLRELVNAGQL